MCVDVINALTASHGLAGETRFGTQFIMLERVVEVKAALEQLILQESWKKWGARKKFRNRARAVEKKVKSKGFWAKADNLIKLLE